MRHLSLLALPLFSAFVSGCASGGAQRIEMIQSKPGEQIITAEAIAESGATTAWDVLKYAAPHIQFREDRNGNPSRMWRRGRGSVTLNEAPMVILDGIKVPDFRTLDQIPASTIHQISILTGIEGTTYYGTNALGGVILIRTKHGTA